MFIKLLPFIILPFIILSSIRKEYLPLNGQINTAKFFVPKSEICIFNVNVFNLRFKKCKIPIEFGNLIPEITRFYNYENIGITELYNTFCVGDKIKSVNIFDDNESKIEADNFAEDYPPSAVQVIHCENSKSAMNLYDTITKDDAFDKNSEKNYNSTSSEVINDKLSLYELYQKLDEDNEKSILVKFETQPTERQIYLEKQGRLNKINNNIMDLSQKISELEGVDISDDSFNDSDESYNEWINDVIGGYYIIPYLDQSHIKQNNHSLFGKDSGKSGASLSSFDARPIAWMVFFEWENPHHEEKTQEQNYIELTQIINSHETTFKMAKENIQDFKKERKEMQKRNIEKKMGIYYNDRFVFKTSNQYNNKSKQSIRTKDFIKNVQNKIEEATKFT